MVNAPVVVILGARLKPDGSPGPALRRRVDAALDVARRRPVACFLVTGGSNGAAQSEAEAMRDLLVAAGVPPEAILLEPEAADTFGNARLCAPLLAGLAPCPVVLVTDRYHLPRAWLAFRLIGIRAETSGAVWGAGGSGLRRLRAVLREAAAFPWLGLQGLGWHLRRAALQKPTKRR